MADDPPRAFVVDKKAPFDSAYLAAQSRHASGLDERGRERRRPDAGAVRALVFEAQPDGSFAERIMAVGEAVDLRADLVRHLERNGDARGPARVRGGLASSKKLGIHLLVGIGDGVLDGSPYDPDNPALRKLAREAVAWAQHEIGGVWAARVDVDEKNRWTVDVFASPISHYSHARKSPERENRAWVAVSSMHARLRREHKTPYSYTAMQDSWTRWARRTIDNRLRRGVPKAVSGREHYSPETYGAIQRDKQEARIAREKAVEEAAKADALADEAVRRAAKLWEEAKANGDLVAKQRAALAADKQELERRKRKIVECDAKLADLRDGIEDLDDLDAVRQDLDEHMADLEEGELVTLAARSIRRDMLPFHKVTIRAAQRACRKQGFDYKGQRARARETRGIGTATPARARAR